jgi:hypothetical protein
MVLTTVTPINNTYMYFKWKNLKTTNTPVTISSTIFGHSPNTRRQNEIQWTLRHCDPVIGECPLAGFKKGPQEGEDRAGTLSGWSAWYQDDGGQAPCHNKI